MANNIESIEIFPGENDGHRVVHNFKREAGKKDGAMGGGMYMERPKAEEHFFGKGQEGQVLPHVGKAISFPLNAWQQQPNLADLARLILEQGTRPEELLAARKEHFDARAATLLIAGGKTRASRRTVNLTAASRTILERRAQLPGLWLFPSDRHEGYHLTKLAVRTQKDAERCSCGIMTLARAEARGRSSSMIHPAPSTRSGRLSSEPGQSWVGRRGHLSDKPTSAYRKIDRVSIDELLPPPRFVSSRKRRVKSRKAH